MPQHTKPDPAPAWATPADIPSIMQLWETCFGDAPGEIAPFFQSQFTTETSAILRMDGGVVSMMHLLPCRMRNIPGCYVYAVATAPAYRGRGFMRLLDDFCVRAAKQSGRRFLLLVPAEPALFRAYEKLGYRVFSSLQKQPLLPHGSVGSASVLPQIHPAPLSFDEFYALRTRYLERFSLPVRFENGTERFAYEDFLRHGVIYGDANDYFCARLTEGAAEITETTLLPESLPAYLASCGAFSGVRSIVFRRSGGTPYSMIKWPEGLAPSVGAADGCYFSFPLD